MQNANPQYDGCLEISVVRILRGRMDIARTWQHITSGEVERLRSLPSLLGLTTHSWPINSEGHLRAFFSIQQAVMFYFLPLCLHFLRCYNNLQYRLRHLLLKNPQYKLPSGSVLARIPYPLLSYRVALL
jgi:hypothetical protein